MNINYSSYVPYKSLNNHKKEFCSRWYYFRDFILGTVFPWEILHLIYSFIMDDIKIDVTKKQVQYFVCQHLTSYLNKASSFGQNLFEIKKSDFLFQNHNIKDEDLFQFIYIEFKKNDIECKYFNKNMITSERHLFTLDLKYYRPINTLRCYNLNKSYESCNTVEETSDDCLLIKEKGEELNIKLKNLIEQRELDDSLFRTNYNPVL
tara:strand:- start:18336 stop:18953 length:618 start_codon:yes stop_codon:yes gene_type:complete